MNPLRDKKGIFFLLMACVVHVFMLLSCTLWRGIILPTCSLEVPASGAGLLVLAVG